MRRRWRQTGSAPPSSVHLQFKACSLNEKSCGKGSEGALCFVKNDNEMIGKGHRDFGLASYHILSRVYTAFAEWAHTGSHLHASDKHSWCEVHADY